MVELIKVSQTERGNQIVDGRELHEFLEVGKDFTTWMKDRIEKFGFVEHEDYKVTMVLPNFGENPLGGRPKTEYTLKINMAKELSMVENNDKGRQARKYFIACEEKLREIASQPVKPLTGIEYAKLLLESEIKAEETRKQLSLAKEKITIDAPKVLFADSIMASESTVLIKVLSTILSQNGIDMGQNRLFEWMRSNGYLCKVGSRYNLPTQKSLDLGLMEVSTSVVHTGYSSKVCNTTKVTGKGQEYFINMFLKSKEVSSLN